MIKFISNIYSIRKISSGFGYSLPVNSLIDRVFVSYFVIIKAFYASIAERPPINNLLRVGSPPAITRLIVPVVIYPINRVLWRRFWSHILIEIVKAFSPSLANLDSSHAIRSIPRIFRIRSPLNHAFPRMVFGFFRLSFNTLHYTYYTTSIERINRYDPRAA